MTPRIACAALLAATALLSGCGGGGGAGSPGAPSGVTQTAPAATAQVTFRLTWPKTAAANAAAPRLLPAAATAYVIEILNSSSTVIAHQTISKPATQATFTGLPVGTLLARIGAYASDPGYPVPADATPLASASVPLTLQAGSNNAAPAITLGSTIDHIAPSVTSLSLNVNGASGTLTATAQTGATATPPNATVLIPTTQLQWVSSDTTVATLTPVNDPTTHALTGYTVNGVKAGPATITIADPESGKSAQIAVTVNAPGNTNTAEIDVTLSDPPPGTLSASVTLTGGANPLTQTVAWPVTASTEMVAFTNLAPGTYSVTAKAYSQANAGGSALSADLPNPAATAAPTATQKGAASIDLGGSADTLTLTPANPTIYDSSAASNSTVQLSATVQGPGGLSAPVTAGTLSWSLAPATATPATGTTVDANGNVTAGPTDGTVGILASDRRTPTVTGQTTVTVSPSTGSATGTVQ